MYIYAVYSVAVIFLLCDCPSEATKAQKSCLSRSTYNGNRPSIQSKLAVAFCGFRDIVYVMATPTYGQITCMTDAQHECAGTFATQHQPKP